MAASARLERLVAQAPSPGLARRAEVVDDPGGRWPLLGTAARASAFPALLWNGARMHAENVDTTTALLLLAHVTAAPAAGLDLPTGQEPGLADAVAAGLRVRDLLPGVPAGAVAEPGLGVLVAAATAATAARRPSTDRAADLGALLDLAGTLAVIAPQAVPDGAAPEADLRAGHALATGWLVVRLHAAGLVSPPGAAHATAVSVTDAVDLSWPGSWT